MVRTVAKQKLCLHITLGTRYHALCTQLLQQRGGLQRVLKVSADGHHADVKISHPQRPEECRVGAVPNLRIGDERHDLVDPFLVCIHSHDLMPHLCQLRGDMPSKAAHADQ